MSTTSYCGTCGNTLEPTADYCPVCGTSTSSGNTLAQEITSSLNIDVMWRRTGAMFIRGLVSVGNSSLFGLLSLFLFFIDLILMRNGQDWTARIFCLLYTSDAADE